MKFDKNDFRMALIEHGILEILAGSDVIYSVPHDVFNISSTLFDDKGNFICSVSLKLKF